MFMAFAEDRRALPAFECTAVEAFRIDQLPNSAFIEEVECRSQPGDGPTALRRLDCELANDF